MAAMEATAQNWGHLEENQQGKQMPMSDAYEDMVMIDGLFLMHEVPWLGMRTHDDEDAHGTDCFISWDDGC